MSDPLISIIVPIYKVEPYLRQCIDSIVLQTYRNLEIILVDDGSSDNCPAICDEYEKADERIRVIHKGNGGLSDARNAGLDIATGDYIGFVDSDDWITLDMYEHLVRTILNYKADICVCGYEETNGKRILARKSIAPREKKYSVEDAFREVLLSGEILVVMWNKIYRSDLFDEIRFPKDKTFEDGAVFYKLFDKSTCIAHTGRVGYYYRKRTGSITFSDYQMLSENVMENYLNLEIFLRDRFPSLVREVPYYRAETEYYIAAKYQQVGKPSGSSEYIKTIDNLKRDIPLVLSHPRWNIAKKAKVLMLLTGSYSSARKIYHRIKSQ